MWDGYRTIIDGNPYLAAPSAWFGATNLPSKIDAVLSQVNYPDVPTIYGPALQHLFAVCAWLDAGALWPWKLMLCVADMALVVWIARSFGTKRAMLYAWSPLVVHEIAVAAHPDGLIGALVFAATMLALRQQHLWMMIVVGTAIAMKIHIVMLLPFLVLIVSRCHSHSIQTSTRMPISYWRAAMVIVGIAIVYAAHWLPFASGFTNAWQSFDTFARLWQFNAMGFAALQLLFPNNVRIVSLALIATCILYSLWWLYEEAYHARSIGQSTQNENMPLVQSVALAVCTAFGALLFFAPVINAWYLLWLLPLACATRCVTPWVAMSVLPLSYTTHHH